MIVTVQYVLRKPRQHVTYDSLADTTIEYSANPTPVCHYQPPILLAFIIKIGFIKLLELTLIKTIIITTITPNSLFSNHTYAVYD